MNILYFAWLRERIGVAQEQRTPPDDVRTVEELMGWLAQQSPGHARAFENARLVRCAVDQEFVAQDAAIAGAQEIAFFPPVTGG
jgi:molybdopterin synthase sulfur carrier subunit